MQCSRLEITVFMNAKLISISVLLKLFHSSSFDSEPVMVALKLTRALGVGRIFVLKCLLTNKSN